MGRDDVGGVTDVRRLSSIDTDELLRRYAAAPSHIELRNAVVERFLPYARGLARRYSRVRDRQEDLEQVAAVALVKAVDRYDPTRGGFAAFAAPTILGEVRRYLRDTAWPIRPVRSVHELAVGVASVTDQLTAELGRSPAPQEVADATGNLVEEVLEAQEALLSSEPESLDACPSTDVEQTLGDLVASPQDDYAGLEDRLTVEAAAVCLPERDRMILALRFERDLSQAEIGVQMGISQMQVSRILRRSLKRIQTIVIGRDGTGRSRVAA